MESFGNENKKRRTCEIDTDSRIDRLTEMLHQQQELLNVIMGFQSNKSTTSNLSVYSKPKFSQIISNGSQNVNQKVSISNQPVEETMPSTGKNIKINKTSPIPSVDEYSIKIRGKDILNYKRSTILANEIKRCKPNVVTSNVFINKENLLIIKTTSPESLKQLNEPWPTNAFGSGVEIIKKNQRFFAAIRNIDQEEDFEDEVLATELKEKYHIIKAIRLVKKSENNRPLNIVKIEFDEKEYFEKALSQGIYIGSTRFRIEKWKFVEGPMQCIKCQKYGHKSYSCNSPVRCQLCGEENHDHKNCQKRNEPKCCNCNQNHAASSKQCAMRIDLTKKMKLQASSGVFQNPRTTTKIQHLTNQSPAHNNDLIMKKLNDLEYGLFTMTSNLLTFIISNVYDIKELNGMEKLKIYESITSSFGSTVLKKVDSNLYNQESDGNELNESSETYSSSEFYQSNGMDQQSTHA
jgi:hypothetical protein